MAEFTMIVDAISELKSMRKGQFAENIEELMSKNHQWDTDKTRVELEKAVSDKLLKKFRVNDRFSYRLIKDNSNFEDTSAAATTEPEKDISTSILANDFEDFKKFMLSELGVLKNMFSSSSNCSCNLNTPVVASDKGHESLAINCLKEHIKSFEKELSAKQDIINKLLDKSDFKTPDSTKETFQNNDKNKKGVSEITSIKSKNFASKKNSQKSKVVIIGDSMINGIHAKGFKNNNVSIKAHPGATAEDLIHYIKPIINKKPDQVIIHCGTNDIPNNIKSIDNFKQIDDYVKVNSPETKLVLSTIITRKDVQTYDVKIDTMNERIKKFASKNNIPLIDHSNIDEGLLNPKKLHLNKKGYSYLANNIISHLKN